MGDHCEGQWVGCEPDELRYQVYLTTPTTPSTLAAVYCQAAGSGVISEASVMPDIRRYLDQISVAPPAISSWPGDATLVNLPTYFAATPAAAGDRIFGGLGYVMTLNVTPQSYDWDFGDGVTTTTTDPGSGPPGGDVTHVYQRAGGSLVTMSVGFAASYSLTTPAGTLGPLPVDGVPVRSAAGALSLRIDEAIATLTR